MLLLTVVAPGGAEAKSGYEVRSASRDLQLDLAGNHGYSVAIEAHGNGQVLLRTSKGAGDSTYSVHGSLTRNHLKARFGHFGKVDVAFHVLENTAKAVSDFGSDCSGPGTQRNQ